MTHIYSKHAHNQQPGGHPLHHGQAGSRSFVMPLLLCAVVAMFLLMWSQQRELIHHYINDHHHHGAWHWPRHLSNSALTAAAAAASGCAGLGSSSTGSHAARPPPEPLVPGCEAAVRPKVALLMVVVGYEGAARHDAYWVAVANRRAYAQQHAMPLYLVPAPLGSGQHAAWEKLVALQAVFQHSCATWVWMSDADAFVMNLGRSVAVLAARPQAARNPKQQACSTASPNVILAGACLSRVNTGSVLWRNTGWTHQYVADAWHSKHIARPAKWWDQAAVLHLMKQPAIAAHHCLVYQRAINAYPNLTRCHDGGGVFKDGDLLVHFPGGMKVAIANMSSSWLQSVPLIAPRTAAAAAAAAGAGGRDMRQNQGAAAPPLVPARPAVWTIAAFNSSSSSSSHSQQVLSGPGRRLHVTMPSTMYGNASSMPTDFVLFIEPQMRGLDNWGWPLHPPAHARLHPQLSGGDGQEGEAADEAGTAASSSSSSSSGGRPDSGDPAADTLLQPAATRRQSR